MNNVEGFTIHGVDLTNCKIDVAGTKTDFTLSSVIYDGKEITARRVGRRADDQTVSTVTTDADRGAHVTARELKRPTKNEEERDAVRVLAEARRSLFGEQRQAEGSVLQPSNRRPEHRDVHVAEEVESAIGLIVEPRNRSRSSLGEFIQRPVPALKVAVCIACYAWVVEDRCEPGAALVDGGTEVILLGPRRAALHQTVVKDAARGNSDALPLTLLDGRVEHQGAQAVEVVCIAVRHDDRVEVDVIAPDSLVPEAARQVAGGELVLATVDQHSMPTRRRHQARVALADVDEGECERSRGGRPKTAAYPSFAARSEAHLGRVLIALENVDAVAEIEDGHELVEAAGACL